MITEHKTIKIADMFAIRDLLKSAAKKNTSEIWANAHRTKVKSSTAGAVWVNRLKLNLVPATAKTMNEIDDRIKKVTGYKIKRAYQSG